MQHLDLFLQPPYNTLAICTSETSETLETDACNMGFQAQHLLAVWTKMEASSSMQSSTPAWRSMLRSGAEVADVELVGSTDLGKGRGRRMERGRNRRRECGQGHTAQVWAPSRGKHGRAGEVGPAIGRRRWGRRGQGLLLTVDNINYKLLI
jgi:hypothetical protein